MILSFSIFTFESGDEEKVKKGIDEHLSMMQGQPGLIRCFIGKALDHPGKYLLYGEWDSKEQYERFGEKIREAKDAQHDFEEFFDLMSEEPVFGSFEIQK